MWDEYISKLNFTALCIIKPKVMVSFLKLSNETIYGLIPYKEGYVNEAYTFFSRFWQSLSVNSLSLWILNALNLFHLHVIYSHLCIYRSPLIIIYFTGNKPKEEDSSFAVSVVVNTGTFFMKICERSLQGKMRETILRYLSSFS